MPIDSTEISSQLTILDSLHQTDSNNILYYQKLAIIELCGWIEFSMDSIAKNFFDKYATNDRCRKIFEKTIIAKNNGFKYEDNFCAMLYKTIGIHNFRRVEDAITQDKIATLESALEALTKLRNDVAHTHIGRGTLTQSPSLTIAQLNVIAPILDTIYNEVDKL